MDCSASKSDKTFFSPKGSLSAKNLENTESNMVTASGKSSNSSQLVASQLAPTLDELYNHFVTEITETKGKYSLQELMDMLRVCPVNRAAIELKALRAMTALGEYHNSDPTLYATASGNKTMQEWVRGNFESMRGNLSDVSSKLIRQAYSLGHCCGEILWERKINYQTAEWRLKKIKILNPLQYSFAGKIGEVDRIIYRSRRLTPFAIPYSKLVHIYNPAIDEPEDPVGEAQASLAYPFFKARQLMLMQWTTAGQRQATGFIVIKTPADKTVAVYTKDGKPEINSDGSAKTQSSAMAVANSAKEIENGCIFVTDKENDVIPITTNAGEGFFNTALTYYQKMIFYSYGIPSTIFDDTASGIGNAGINAGHKLILDAQIEAIIQSLREELIEKVIRPLLLANFGTRFEDNLGEFKSEKFLDPMQASARVNNLTLALTNGIIDNNDLEGVNRLREDLGISPISKENFDKQQLAKLMAQQEAEQASYPEEGQNDT